MSNSSTSPLAGQKVRIKSTVAHIGGNEYHVEDYWHILTGKSWMFCDGNPACLDYAVRAGAESLPMDDRVLYGKMDNTGKLVHISEIEEG